MRILLVDDSATMRRIQKNQLAGLEVKDILESADGQDALTTLKNNMPVDLVLLDWNMPVMDGLACLEAIRADAEFKDVKVIMCTSEAEKSKVFEAMKAGAANYMVKPFTQDTLKQKLGI